MPPTAQLLLLIDNPSIQIEPQRVMNKTIIRLWFVHAKQQQQQQRPFNGL